MIKVKKAEKLEKTEKNNAHKKCGAFLGLIFIMSLFLFAAMPCEYLYAAGKIYALEDCLEIALQVHPDIKAALARERSRAQKVLQQEAGLNPGLTASASPSTRQDDDPRATASLRLTKLLSDSGKTNIAIDVAKLELKAASFDTLQAIFDVRLAVKENFYSVLKAQRDEDAARSTVKFQESQSRQSHAFYEAGKVPRSDVTAAEVDLGKARLALTQAEGSVKQTKAALVKAMGLFVYSGDFSVFALSTPDVKFYEPIELAAITAEDEALQKAFSNRPSLRAHALRLEQYFKYIAAAAKELGISVSAWGGYGYTAQNGPDIAEWDAGVTFSIPIIDGGKTDAKVLQARADYEETAAADEKLRQQTALEVVQSIVAARTGAEKFLTARMIVGQAEENLRLAAGRYKAGIGSALEVSQASLNLDVAQKDLNQAMFDYVLGLTKFYYLTAAEE